MAVDHCAVVGGHVAPAARVAQLVELDGRVRAPAPQDGGVELVRVEVGVPVAALHAHLDADAGHLVGKLVGQRLAGGVARRVEQLERGTSAALGQDAVVAGLPASLFQQALGFFHVALDLHVVAAPGHAVAHAVGGAAVAAEHVVDHGLAVDGQVHGTAHGDVCGHVVAHGVRGAVHAEALLAAGRARGQRDAARVDGGALEELVALGHLVCHEGGGVGDVDLAGLAGCQGGVLLHEDDHHALHERGLAVVAGVGDKDHLLALVPLLHQVAAAADGCGTVVGGVAGLGHDAQHGQGVEQGVVGLGHLQHKRVVVLRHGLLDHREVCLGVGGADDGVDGEGGVARGEGRAVREDHVLAQGEGPGHAVARADVVCGEVRDKLEVLVCGDEGRLDEGLVHMLTATPGDAGVEAGRRLRAGAHGDDNLGGIGGGTRAAVALGASSEARPRHTNCSSQTQGFEQGAAGEHVHESLREIHTNFDFV